MPTTRKPTPFSEQRLPGWACRLAERATQGRLTTLDKLWPYPELILQGGDDSGPVADRSLADPESADPTPLFPPGG